MTETSDLTLAAELAKACRARWPETRFRRSGTALRWVDGPARVDVLSAADAAGHPRAELDVAGVRLVRSYSRQVIATVPLVALDLAARDAACGGPVVVEGLGERSGERVERWCLGELAELQRYAIPAGGPPPLGPATSPVELEEAWERARRLIEVLGTDRPVIADQVAALRRVLRRLGALALVVGTDRLEQAAIRKVPGQGPEPARYLPSQTLFLDVPLAAWPDALCTAIVPSDQQLRAVPPSPRLRWTDGPSPSQLEVRFAGGLPDPLAGCEGFEADRQLSVIGIAASVLLHRTLHATPYRDRAARYHWMARWKSAAVRDLDRLDKPARDRLARIQRHLLELPLPLTGPLPAPLAAGGWSDGDRLWAAAEVLLALTRDRIPDVAQRDRSIGLPAAERLAVELSSTLEDTGTDALALLLPHRSAHPGHPIRR